MRSFPLFLVVLFLLGCSSSSFSVQDALTREVGEPVTIEGYFGFSQSPGGQYAYYLADEPTNLQGQPETFLLLDSLTVRSPLGNNPLLLDRRVRITGILVDQEGTLLLAVQSSELL